MQLRTIEETKTKMTYYDILGVARSADQAAIRKGYLRASLRCHPDKNPGREEESKAEFVEVGQAYSVLSDVTKRAAYDRELAGGNSGGSRPQTQAQRQTQTQTQTQTKGQSSNDDVGDRPAGDKDFDDFMRMFDETVSGMSEEELNMAMGAAAIVGSVIGSILGARTAGGRGGNALLSSVASTVGSALASRAAGSLVQAVHEDSKQRVLERRELDAAIARGETAARLPTSRESRDRVVQDAGRAFKRAAGAAVSGTGVGFHGRTRTTDNSDGGVTQNADGRGRFSWAQAAELVLDAVSVCAEMQQSGGGSNAKHRQRNNR
ncbi:hypothetical protein ACHAW5_009181 [Stephanodiscus triporus]|uniref:J domain-containing protein n=1 Tax=Stephanodiscus triporus TaxID=2934178 RepID=A0ABD3PZ25_9STRA